MTKEEVLKRIREIDDIISDPLYDDWSDEYFEYINEINELYFILGTLEDEN